MGATGVLRSIAQKPQGLSWDFPFILTDFSLDLVVLKQDILNPVFSLRPNWDFPVTPAEFSPDPVVSECISHLFCGDSRFSYLFFFSERSVQTVCLSERSLKLNSTTQKHQTNVFCLNKQTQLYCAVRLIGDSNLLVIVNVNFVIDCRPIKYVSCLSSSWDWF